MAGKKCAVLVGCNYPRTSNELQGCINDVIAMYHTLVHRFGFHPHDIVMLTDAPNGIVETRKPTGANIKHALRHMIDQAKSGDVLLFHFSGHGTLLNKHDDAIVPCDFNMITDHNIRTLVNLVPQGASFTILSDSCNSGGLIDKEKEQIGPHHHMKGSSSRSHHHKARGMHHHEILQQLSSMSDLDSDDIGTHLVHLYGEDASPQYHSRDATRNVRVHQDNGILLSGCQKNEFSTDVSNGKPHGAFTNALLSVLKRHGGPISNAQLVRSTRKLMHDQEFNDQNPCLYCSDAKAHAHFLGQK